MEVKMNKEIRQYSEVMFFGLNLRQLVFSALAVLTAVCLYFLLKGKLSSETISWVCILGAAPLGALGFVSYHGMSAEECLFVWLRSEILEKHVFPYSSTSLYEKIILEARKADRRRNIDQNTEKPSRTGKRKVSYPQNSSGPD